jgi:hypothetical protein
MRFHRDFVRDFTIMTFSGCSANGIPLAPMELAFERSTTAPPLRDKPPGDWKKTWLYYHQMEKEFKMF